jgi:oligosaccharide repeat unit polymerase
MEANWSAIVLLSLVTGVAVCTGRVWFKHWFNPLSVYSAIWGFCLCSYELKLIQFYPVSRQAWLYIFLAWESLYAGAGVAFLVSSAQSARKSPMIDLMRLKKAILVLTLIGTVGVLDQMRTLYKEFGSVFAAVFLNSGDIYLGRIGGSLSSLPYVGACLFAAIVLAGSYTAKIGRLSSSVVLLLTLVLLQGALEMARLGFVMAALLFLSAYFHTPDRVRLRLSRRQQALLALLILGVGFGAVVFVSSVRGLAVDFPGRTAAIDSITEYVPFFPSVYANFAAPPVALSLYLGSPAESRQGYWGKYTLGPIYRLLSRFGLSQHVSQYEEDYYTPVPVNTSTYIKDIDSDFGLLGVVLFPFLLGFLTTGLFYASQTRGGLVGLLSLAYLYVLLILSFMMNLMSIGVWTVGLGAGLIAAYWVQRPRTQFFRTASAKAVSLRST